LPNAGEEGVLWKTDFWYSRAGRVRPEMPLEEEWRRLAEEMIGYQLLRYNGNGPIYLFLPQRSLS